MPKQKPRRPRSSPRLARSLPPALTNHHSMQGQTSKAAPAASSIPVVRLKRKQSIGCGDDPNGKGKNDNAKATEALKRRRSRKRVCMRAWHTTFDGEIRESGSVA